MEFILNNIFYPYTVFASMSAGWLLFIAILLVVIAAFFSTNKNNRIFLLCIVFLVYIASCRHLDMNSSIPMAFFAVISGFLHALLLFPGYLLWGFLFAKYLIPRQYGVDRDLFPDRTEYAVLFWLLWPLHTICALSGNRMHLFFPALGKYYKMFLDMLTEMIDVLLDLFVVILNKSKEFFQFFREPLRRILQCIAIVCKAIVRNLARSAR